MPTVPSLLRAELMAVKGEVPNAEGAAVTAPLLRPYVSPSE
jgi:hypothetical protein